jgi:hypothetical protein
MSIDDRLNQGAADLRESIKAVDVEGRLQQLKKRRRRVRQLRDTSFVLARGLTAVVTTLTTLVSFGVLIVLSFAVLATARGARGSIVTGVLLTSLAGGLFTVIRRLRLQVNSRPMRTLVKPTSWSRLAFTVAVVLVMSTVSMWSMHKVDDWEPEPHHGYSAMPGFWERATFFSPTDGQEVGSVVRASGDAYLEPHSSLWLVLRPQTRYVYQVASERPVNVDTDGTWELTFRISDLLVDNGTSPVSHFRLLAVVTSQKGTSEIRKTMRDNSERYRNHPYLTRLPQGTETYDEILLLWKR